MDSDDEQNVIEVRRKKKTHHRHTPRQIQELEAMFNVCPHPDEKQRMQLSRDLGLEPRQIKFWFQNRRTQMKAQYERADNCALRAENDNIRCENVAMREALRNVICPTCGSSQAAQDPYFTEQKLRIENSRLKEELNRVSTITSKYLGRPITQLPQDHQLSVSSLELTVGGYSNPGFTSSLDLHLLAVTPPSSAVAFPFPAIPETQRSMMVEAATRGMDEVIRLAQTEEPLWNRAGSDGREALNLETYDQIFPRQAQQLRPPDARVEASRYSGKVLMSSSALVDMFMDSGKWMELFPTIVSNARTLEFLMRGMDGSRSGALFLMYGEFLGLSPMVPSREFCFLRYCQQMEQGLWVISDISIQFPKDKELPFCAKRRLPSGCLIQDMPDGCSNVLWVEHMEIEEKNPAHQVYNDLAESGVAFGAQRWVATLQRMCERIAHANSPRDLGGVIPTAEGKRSLMKLSQRMVSNFCSTLGSSNGHHWAAPSELDDVGVRVTVHKCSDSDKPNGIFLGASTSIWLPFSHEAVFTFFRDERSRVQWDVLSNGKAVQEVTRINNGQHRGNCISLLRVIAAMSGTSPNERNMLILQESCIDSWGSLVVYASVDLPSINIAMSGEDPSFIPLLPSGFVVTPDGRPFTGISSSSSSGPNGVSSGSVLTVAFQIMVSSLPSAKLNLESVATVNRLISATVRQIKAALSSLDG